MARNRSQSARTDAERARARAERARKRAEREGVSVPAELESPPTEVEPAAADLAPPPTDLEPGPAGLELPPTGLAPPPVGLEQSPTELEPGPAEPAPSPIEVGPARAEPASAPNEVEPAPADFEPPPDDFESALAPWPGELAEPGEVESSSRQAATSPAALDATSAALDPSPTDVEQEAMQAHSDATTVEHQLAAIQPEDGTLEPGDEPEAHFPHETPTTQPPGSEPQAHALGETLLPPASTPPPLVTPTPATSPPSSSVAPPTPATSPPTPATSPPTPATSPPTPATSPPSSSASPPTPVPATTLPPAPPAPPALRATAAHRRSPGRRVLAVVALVVVAVAVWLILDRPGSSKHVPAVAAPVVVHVVIPEGYTRAQIAARAHEDGLTHSYLAASKRSSSLDPASYGAPHDTPSLEGFLFPATYDMYKGTSASKLVSEQLVAFHERFSDDFVRRAKALHVTPYQLLTIASIIEREAQLPGDRAKVAAVLYNRLQAGMPLAVDATLRYALNDFTRPLTKAQLALSSPYNTRLHHGLPPTPISNPGIAAIEAAAHPDHVSYLYYVAGADGCGEEVFSTSIATFERDAAAYREALRRNGGNVPTCPKKR